MKDYTPGLLVHRCSNAMRIGKLVKIFANTETTKRRCPNCKKMDAEIVVDADGMAKVLSKVQTPLKPRLM